MHVAIAQVHQGGDKDTQGVDYIEELRSGQPSMIEHQ
jgi:hypothetical protein